MSQPNLLAVPPVVVAGPARHLTVKPFPYAVTAVELSVVVPFRRPDERLLTVLRDVSRILHAQGISFELIAVPAGRLDGDPALLEKLAYTRVVRSRDQQDKGAAMEVGFAMATGAWVCFLDAEGDDEIDAYELAEHFHRAREGDA
ncbi:glycosyltransferase family 2 protein [Nucisporomicrobium flavum]|jgi:Glycosyl transferase family 2|uniref:glycosyltransferase family 2 protein n=1 Tax=Nucisporomicrobium flavum TaxID=2785915 RepID=UPI0018F67E93|nr:glycosyltransferase [Nucisporomicrobium flavum]